MHPLQKRKAGVIIQQMMAAGYVESDCQAVCQALFVGGVASSPCWAEAWQVFDTDGSGELDADEFKTCLKLLGENVTEERATFLMERADEDRSGLIEFDEFVMLLRSMNPRPTVGGAFKNKKKPKLSAGETDDAKEAAIEETLGQNFDAWMLACGIEDYTEEFMEAGLTNPREVSTMTLISLGQKLRLSNSERNMLHGKICAYARFVETEYERTKLKSAVHFANERAWAAKRRIRLKEEEEAKFAVRVGPPPPKSVSTIKAPSCLRQTMSRHGLRPMHRILAPITPQPGLHGLQLPAIAR